MKKTYTAPEAELIAFNIEEDMLGEPIVTPSVVPVDPDSVGIGDNF